MAVSDAQRISIAKYRQEKRDQLSVDVPKGKRGLYKAIAAEYGLSLSMLIQKSVETFAGIDDNEFLPVNSAPMKSKPVGKLSATDKKLVENFNALSPKSQKALREIISELIESKGGNDNGND